MGRTRNRVIYTRPATRGWATVELQARLLAELCDAELIVVSDSARRREHLRRAGGLLPRGRSRPGSPWCIVVAPAPVHLSAVVSLRHLTVGYAAVAGWVVDSFWDDRIPLVARGRGHFDRLFVTDAELTASWEDQTGTTTSWLPFGADVLRRGSASPERGTDLLRVGRQPPTWDDDEHTRRRAEQRGLRFAGRPPMHGGAEANQAALLGAMRAARFTLSFTNLASPDTYTHPTRDYLTGRWTDALACGCVVAGIPPRAEAARLLLWPESVLVLNDVGLEAGLDRVADAVASWTPELAALNHRMALERLDWRWRFLEILTTLEVAVPTRLQDELAEISDLLDA